MENGLGYILENGLVTVSKEKENIYNEIKKSGKIIEEINVEEIPLCIECILEEESGNYICGDCKINLCPYHVKEHIDKFENHKFSFLKS